MDRETNLNDFWRARLGVFVHFGLYSLLGRGEWALNKEQIPVEDYKALADRFDPVEFDADDLARRAKAAGARYLTFTTMHHDGYALYDSAVNPFNSVKRGPGRDLVGEVVEACRKHGLRVHLYHSLNHWTTEPDGADALENEQAKKQFVDFAHERIRELVTRYNPIDCLWYDGWWPFDREGWRATEMNEMVRSIQPHMIFNGRNGLPGDFSTPEQHLGKPDPNRPWEACMTHNNHWGYHRGDTRFKSTTEVLEMLSSVASGAGNLLINVGPDGRGAIPRQSARMLHELGQWLKLHEEALFDTEPITLDPLTRGDHRGDWTSHGQYTVRGHTLYVHLLSWPGPEFSVGGLEVNAKSITCLTDPAVPVRMHQEGRRLHITGLPGAPPHPEGGVLKVECDGPPVLYMTGGLRVPSVTHPRYDPQTPDLPW